MLAKTLCEARPKNCRLASMEVDLGEGLVYVPIVYEC